MSTRALLGRLLVEASAVAVAVEQDWPRLQKVAAGRLSEATPGEILRLVREIRSAPLDARRRSGTPPAPVAMRARALLREVNGVLRAYGQLHHDDALVETLKRVERQQPVRATTESALAGALEARVIVAAPLRDALHGFGDFDGATLDRAREAVAELRALPAQRRDAQAKRRAEKAERDARVDELEAIIRDVRAAARFVFRDEPDRVRAFTSEHGRRVQRAHRAAKKKTADAGSKNA